MKNFKISGLLIAAGITAGLLGAAAPARAQISSEPMVVKQNPPKKVWLKAAVIHADGNSMIVQDEKNSLMVYTFTFSPALRDRMQRISDAGGYQYGDKVHILYNSGETVALDVRGKPSKPL
jgi:hypothetical protein